MILNSQPLFQFAYLRVNSWFTSSSRPRNAKPPYPAHLASCALMLLSLVLFRPSWLRGYSSIMQNKPNFQNAEITATSYATKSYTNIPSHGSRKNKPNQTQSRDTQYAARCALHAMRNKPNLSRRSLVRSRIPPQYAIRNTKYDLRNALHASRFTRYELISCRTQLSK